MAKILVVDDERHIVRLVQVNLERAGHEVVTASDGIEAIQKVAEERPDLMVLDIMMPRKDGWETMRDLAVDPATAGLPIIVLSAKAQDADIAKTLMGGAIHLTKPFNPRELLLFVERILQFADAGDEQDDEVTWEV